MTRLGEAGPFMVHPAEAGERGDLPRQGAWESVDVERLHQAIPGLAGKSVLIIGDVMLDQYIFGTVERISPEAPVPVVMTERHEHRLGGASNVARNIAALGGRSVLLGLLGDDEEGRQVRRLLQEHGIGDCCRIAVDRPTTTKTRVIAQQQQVVRIDREAAHGSWEQGREDLLADVGEHIQSTGVIILSDYGKGLVNREFVLAIQRLCSRQNPQPFILVDPKPKNFNAYLGVDLLTPNAREAGIEGRIEEASLSRVARAGQDLLERLQSRHVLITLGASGMMLLESAGKAVHIPTAARTVFDVTGAGDTVIAVLGLCLAAGMTALEGCLLANYAAGLVVGQVGAAAVSQEQLKQAVLSCPALAMQRLAIGKA